MAKKRATGFAVRLRMLREAAELTQAQLAEKAGLHLMGLVKIEHGSREPAWPTVLAIADALGVSVSAFVSDEPDTEPEKRGRGRPAKAEPVPEPEPMPVKKSKGKGKKG